MKTLLMAILVSVAAQSLLMAAEGRFEKGVLEAKQNGGVVVVPAHPAFFQKSRAAQVKTLSDIWKLLELKGGTVRRMDVVPTGSSKVTHTFTLMGGLVAAPSR